MLYLELLFFLVFGYYVFHFIQVLIRLGHKIVLPASEEDLKAIRTHPEKPTDYPSFQKQKVAILLYSGALLFVFLLFVFLFFFRDPESSFNWALYITLLLPLSYTDLFNLFAILDDGMLVGSKFIPWGKIKDFQFVPIDMNHRYYGYDRQANNGYELKVKGKFRTYHCVVVTEKMKERLDGILSERIAMNGNDHKNEERSVQ